MLDHYEMSYIKKGLYYLYVLDDQNQNIYYDLPNEKIGFFDNVISFDTANNINISPIILFSDYGSKSLNIHSSSLNHILMTGWFDTDIFNIKYNEKLISRTLNDSLVLFNSSDRDSIYDISFSNGLIDTTFQIVFNKKKGSHAFKVLSDEYNLFNDSLLEIQLSAPIKAFNGNVFIEHDSLTFCIDSFININNVFSAKIHYKFRPGTLYSLIFKDSSFTDLYNNYSSRSVLNINYLNDSDLGSLILNYDNSMVNGTELILLYTKNELVESKHLSKSNSSISFNNLLQGSYDLFLIEDKDKNGTWSTGIFSEKRLPEKTLFSKRDIKIRANWEMEDSISLKSAYK